MNPLISVIVPVYNVEKYIDRCVTSIVEQTYTNLEIILVDDGSPDNSGTMCDEWAGKDRRIVVYHKKNGGLSDARNFGTQRAKGELVTYIDSDDYVLPEYIEHLYSCLVQYDADISCCDLKYVYADERLTSFEENKNLNSTNSLSGKDACFDLLNGVKGIYFIISPCKLYKRTILMLYQYPFGRYHEDEATTYKYLYSARTVATSDKMLYAYYQNPASITHNRSEKNHKDFVWALTERADFFRQHQDRTFEIATWDGFMAYYIYHVCDGVKRLPKEAFVLAKQHWFNGDLLFRTKLKFILYAISPRLFRIVMNILFND